MPRTTKKTTTPVENPSIPTVPVAEQPYQVPENWRWVRLSQIIDVQKEKTENFSDESIRYIGLENMEKDVGIVSYGCASDIKSLKNVFKAGNILYGKLRPYLNKHDVAPFDGICSTDILVFNIKNNTINNYVNHYFDLQCFIEYAVSNSKGINLPRVSADIIMNATIPLPPLAEQHRIVDRIESLFAKLDEAREKAQAVVDGFENRKAAILHKAFTGELTRKWREERGIGMDGWKSVAFNEVASIMCNLVDPVDYQDFPHIAPDSIEKKTGMLLEYRSISEDKVISGKHRFYAGQILYSKIRPYLSKVVVVDFDGLCSADMYPIEANKGVDTYFLWYQMLSDDFIGQASSSGSRTVLPKINQKELSKIRMRVTCIDEQLEIVNSLNHLFAQERRARDLAESVIAQIDGMKKAILARAFRGELGTNVPGEAACEV